MYEGRWADAAGILEAGITSDDASKNQLGKAAKMNLLAEVHLVQNRVPQAVRAAQEAMSLTREDSTLAAAALVLVRAGRRADAQKVVQGFGQQFQRRSRAYGAIVEAEIARSAGQFVEARDAFDRAQKLADIWLGRYLLGVTYVEGSQYVSAQAELGVTDKRRGEATAVFLDDVPSFRYLAPLPYWLGRIQEGITKGSPAAAENYRKFLVLRPEGATDPLAGDARKRLAAMSGSR